MSTGGGFSGNWFVSLVKLFRLWTKQNSVPFQSRYLMVIFPSLYSDTMILDSIAKDVCFGNFCLAFCLGITNRYFGEDILVQYQTKIQWRYLIFFLLYSNQFVEPLEDGLVIFSSFSNQTFPQLKLVFGVTFQPWKPPRQNAGLKRLTSFSHDSVHLEPDALCACWDTWWLDAWRLWCQIRWFFRWDF